jgi:hypothetical protein
MVGICWKQAFLVWPWAMRYWGVSKHNFVNIEDLYLGTWHILHEGLWIHGANHWNVGSGDTL